MRTLRKTIFRLLLLAVAAAVMAGCVLIGRGYQMYQAALTQQSLESKVEELQSDSGYTELSELPEMYLNAVVAVEDHRFDQHFGIDLIAIGRAAWNNLTSWSLQEGGACGKAVAQLRSSLPKICISRRKKVLFARWQKCLWHSDWNALTRKMKFWSYTSILSILGMVITALVTPVKVI